MLIIIEQRVCIQKYIRHRDQIKERNLNESTAKTKKRYKKNENTYFIMENEKQKC